MRVQGDANRQVRADHGAQAAQQFTLAIATKISHHGAVQAKQDAVKRVAISLGRCHDGVCEGVKGVARDESAWLGVGTDHMRDVPVVSGAGLQKTTELGVVVLTRRDGLSAVEQAAFGKDRQVGGQFAEGVGLVQKLGGEHVESGHGLCLECGAGWPVDQDPRGWWQARLWPASTPSG